MVSTVQLAQMANTDINQVDRKDLVDIRTVTVNKELPLGERICDYIKQIKNPYCFKVSDTVVKIKFSDTNITMEQRMEGYFNSL